MADNFYDNIMGEEGEQTLTKSEALKKLTALVKAKKISSVDVSLIEGRINNGGVLPDIMFQEIKEGN